MVEREKSRLRKKRLKSYSVEYIKSMKKADLLVLAAYLGLDLNNKTANEIKDIFYEIKAD